MHDNLQDCPSLLFSSRRYRPRRLLPRCRHPLRLKQFRPVLLAEPGRACVSTGFRLAFHSPNIPYTFPPFLLDPQTP